MASKGKNAKDSYGALSRRDVLLLDPDAVVIVGLDSKDLGHKLLDPTRVDGVDPGLVESILRHGIKVPITVTKEGDRVIVVNGRQRVMAARAANKRLRAEKSDVLVRVPAIINQGDAEATFVIANGYQREDAPIVRARKAEAMRAFGHDEKEIGLMFNASRGTLANWKALLVCVPEVQKEIEAGAIPYNVGYELGKLEPAYQLEALAAVPKEAPVNGAAESTKRENARAIRNVVKGEKSARWSSGQVRELAGLLAPTEEEPHDGGNVELAWALLQVLLGEDATGKGLKGFDEVQKLVKRVLKAVKEE